MTGQRLSVYLHKRQILRMSIVYHSSYLYLLTSFTYFSHFLLRPHCERKFRSVSKLLTPYLFENENIHHEIVKSFAAISPLGY